IGGGYSPSGGSRRSRSADRRIADEGSESASCSGKFPGGCIGEEIVAVVEYPPSRECLDVTLFACLLFQKLTNGLQYFARKRSIRYRAREPNCANQCAKG